MKRDSIVIAVVFLIVGFSSAYLIFGKQAKFSPSKNNTADSGYLTSSNEETVINPFISNNTVPQDNSHTIYLDDDIISIKKQLEKIETDIQFLMSNTGTSIKIQRQNKVNRNRFASALNQRLYNLDNLIRGGIDPSMADDIVRRKNSIELKRLELQDHATRENYLNTDRYFNELEILNQQDVSLREELGDERYDQYLFNSKQNNRIKISSVMLGSVAEQIGIQKGDVVLSYDGNRMFSWQELKDATTEGELGDYVSISIYRKGEIFGFSVPRGPLGMKLGATRLTP